MPRCQDLAIFMVTTTDRQTDRQTSQLLYPCACAWGNYIILQLLHAVQMHKDANAIAHAQDTMLSQNGQPGMVVLHR